MTGSPLMILDRSTDESDQEYEDDNLTLDDYTLDESKRILDEIDMIHDECYQSFDKSGQRLGAD
jgi:hypothetical protein